MASITLEVPENQVERIWAAFADAYGYQDEINDEPNPQTKEEFGKQKVADYIRNTVSSVEGEKAASDARIVAVQCVNDEVVIT